MIYTLYYRNYLKSCNYSCRYCPFSKKKANEVKIEKDKKYLSLFLNYIKNSDEQFRIFFAPRGEALLFSHYKEAIQSLTEPNNVVEVVIQTNLSCDLDWIEDVDLNKLVLWTTYHPNEVDAEKFFIQTQRLCSLKVSFSVGCVGVKGNFAKIEEMNSMLNGLGKDKPYMWINAYKDVKDYYRNEDVEFLKRFDPLFEINLNDYISRKKSCRAGETAFMIEYNGNIYRCWQYKKKLGNLYKDALGLISSNEACNKNICGCYIGYSHIKSLALEKVYRKSLLGRIP